MGVFRIKRILGSKTKPRSHLNPSPARLRSRPRLDKRSLLRTTRPVALPLSLPLISNATRLRAARRARPSAASFFNLYESDGQPPDGKHLATRVSNVSAVAGTPTLEDNMKYSRVLSLVADVTDGRAYDPSFFGAAHAGAEEASDGMDDDLPDFEDDPDTPEGVSSSYETTVASPTPTAFADVTPTIKLEQTSPTLAFLQARGVDVKSGNCVPVVNTVVKSEEKTPPLFNSPLVKVKVEEGAVLFPISVPPPEEYSPPPSPSPVRRKTESASQSLDVLLRLEHGAADHHGSHSDLAAPEIEMTDADSVVLYECAQRYTLDDSPSTTCLPPQLDCWLEDEMEDVEYAPEAPLCIAVATVQDPIWRFCEGDPTPGCCGDGDELFGQNRMKFDGLEGYDDDDNTNMDDPPVMELFAGYFDWTLRLGDTMSNVEDVESSVVYPSDNASVSEEDVAPIPDVIVALDEVSAPCDATEVTLVSIEEIPCLMHAVVDEDEVFSTDSSDASNVERLTKGISEPLPSAADSQQEELPGDLVEDGEATPFDLSFMCLAPTPLCVAGPESCPASLIDYLDGLSDTELAVVKEVGQLDSLFTAQWHATRQSLISALTPRQDELPDGDLAEDDVATGASAAFASTFASTLSTPLSQQSDCDSDDCVEGVEYIPHDIDTTSLAPMWTFRESVLIPDTSDNDDDDDGSLGRFRTYDDDDDDDVNMIEDSSIDGLVLMFEGIGVESAST